MSYSTFGDCDYMSCDKLGSDMICSDDGGCACTLPNKKKNDNYILMFVIVVTVIFLLLFTQSSSNVKCKNIRAMKSKSEYTQEELQEFIQSDRMNACRPARKRRMIDDDLLHRVPGPCLSRACSCTSE